MNGDYSDALVVFGITGDLAFKKIIPALENLERRGRLPPIVVGVARGGVTREALLERVRASLRAARRRHRPAGAAAARGQAPVHRRRLSRRRDVRRAARGARRRAPALPLPGHPAEPVRDGRRASSAVPAARPTRASSSRSRSVATSRARRRSTVRCSRWSTSARSSASIISSARKRCRTCSTSASPTRSSSRSGIARTSSTCRSRWPRSSASRAAASSTRNSAPCATSCRTTCCRCWRSWPWSRRSAPAPRRMRDEKMKVLRAIRHPDRRDIVRGQYDGYRDEDGVGPSSDAETYAALRFEIDSWRWADVPFFIRTGKRLPVTATEVMATFRRPPQRLFDETLPRAGQLPALPAGPGPHRDRARRAHQGRRRGDARRRKPSSTPATRRPTR